MLDEQHWSYMDRFADGMIARGPTLATDRETWTGSLHVLSLPSVEAVHEFVGREPYSRAGLFEDHLIYRFGNLLGRTMWDSVGSSDDPRFLVIAQLSAEVDGPAPVVPSPELVPLSRESVSVHGELLTLDGDKPIGAVLALQAPTREVAQALLSGWQAEIDDRFDVEFHDWEFGGRR